MSRSKTLVADPRKDAKLQNLVKTNAQAAEDLWQFRFPEEGGTVLGFDEIRVECLQRWGVSVSGSTVHSFYQWFHLKRRDDARGDAAEALMEALAKDKSFSPEQVRKAGQRLFMTEGIVTQDVKKFEAMVKAEQADIKLAQNDKRLKQTDKAQAMEARRVAVLEKKAAFYDLVKEKAKDAGTGGVTAEQMEDIERRLKMM